MGGLHLLKEQVVELHIVERASDNTMGGRCEKKHSRTHRKQQWVIPPDASAAFVADMEEVLEVYPGRTIRSVHWCASTKPRSS